MTIARPRKIAPVTDAPPNGSATSCDEAEAHDQQGDHDHQQDQEAAGAQQATASPAAAR